MTEEENKALCHDILIFSDELCGIVESLSNSKDLPHGTEAPVLVDVLAKYIVRYSDHKAGFDRALHQIAQNLKKCARYYYHVRTQAEAGEEPTAPLDLDYPKPMPPEPKSLAESDADILRDAIIPFGAMHPGTKGVQ